MNVFAIAFLGSMFVGLVAGLRAASEHHVAGIGTLALAALGVTIGAAEYGLVAGFAVRVVARPGISEESTPTTTTVLGLLAVGLVILAPLGAWYLATAGLKLAMSLAGD